MIVKKDNRNNIHFNALKWSKVIDNVVSQMYNDSNLINSILFTISAASGYGSRVMIMI